MVGVGVTDVRGEPCGWCRGFQLGRLVGVCTEGGNTRAASV